MPTITLDPTFEAFTARDRLANTRASAPAPKTLSGLRVGLLANGKTNSREILDVLFEELGKAGGLSFSGEPIRVVKGSVSVPPEPEDFRRLVAETDIVLVAIGD
jgi:hypothetical protein